jgi:hypothetical protein
VLSSSGNNVIKSSSDRRDPYTAFKSAFGGTIADTEGLHFLSLEDGGVTPADNARSASFVNMFQQICWISGKGGCPATHSIGP